MSSVGYYLLLLGQSFGIMVLLAWLGYFLITPFCKLSPAMLLASPLAGALFSGLCLCVLYGNLGLPFTQSLWITVIVGSLLTGIRLMTDRVRLKPLYGITAILILALFTFLCNFTAIRFAEPSLMMQDGSDQLGYAQAAQWILHHPATEPPATSAAYPEQSWAAYVFHGDARFISYYLYAVITLLKNIPAEYTYNFAAAIFLVCGLLSLLAVYSRSRTTFILLALVCCTTYLFDYAESGYLGRVISYAGALFIAGLYWRTRDALDATRFACMGLLVAGLALTINGHLISFVLTVSLLFALCVEIILHRKSIWHLMPAAFFILIPLGFEGLLATPHLLGSSAITPDWHTIWVSIFELVTLPPSRSLLEHAPLLTHYLFIILLIFSGVCIVNAIKHRRSLTIAYLAFPLLLMAYADFTHTEGIYYTLCQAIGLYYLMTMIGMIYLYEKNKSAWLLVIIVVELILHVPHFFGTVKRYTYRAPLSQQFLQSQMQALIPYLQRPTLIDTHSPLSIFFVMYYGEHKTLPLYWSTRAWHSILAYRDWPTPLIPTSLKQILCEWNDPAPPHSVLITQTDQYKLYQWNT